MSRFPVMATVLGFTSVHNAVGTKRLMAARDELQASEAEMDGLQAALDEVEEARAWLAEHGLPYEWDEDDPPTVTEALRQVFHWGDSAWDRAGRADERRAEMKQTLAMVGGLLEFEGDTAGALALARETVGGTVSPTVRVLGEIAVERERQEQLREQGRFKHTCADPGWDMGEKLACLAEEFGEVAKALLHQRELVSDGGGDLRTELIQVAAVAAAWAESIQEQP